MGQNTENLKNFIKQHAFDINRRALQTLYSAAKDELSPSEVGKLSELFINAHENILSNLKYVPDFYLYDNRSIKSVTLPKEVTYIGVKAFSFSDIKNIEIPENINFIGADAFYNSSLTNITFNNKLFTIGARAFAYTKLRKVQINTPQLSIFQGAFKSCSKLTLVEIEADQVSLDFDVFANCANLIEIHFPRINSSDLGSIISWLGTELWSKKQVIIYCKDKIFVAGEENG